MISEQKMIEQMEKRKTRIIALCILIPVYCLILGLGLATSRKVMSVVNPTPPYKFDTISLADNLPALLSSYAELSITASRTYVDMVLVSCVLGILIGMLIVEIGGHTHTRLIVSMWKRLEKLEKDVQPKPDGDGLKPAP